MRYMMIGISGLCIVAGVMYAKDGHVIRAALCFYAGLTIAEENL